jgi:hypothetical protein
MGDINNFSASIAINQALFGCQLELVHVILDVGVVFQYLEHLGSVLLVLLFVSDTRNAEIVVPSK